LSCYFKLTLVVGRRSEICGKLIDMRKILLLLGLTLCINSAFGQWVFKTVKNDFDDPFKIAYTSENNGAILKLETLEVEKEMPLELINDSILTVMETKSSIFMYDSIGIKGCVDKGRLTVFSYEIIVIYGYFRCNYNDSIGKGYFKVFSKYGLGVVKEEELGIDSKLVLRKLMNSKGSESENLTRAKALLNENVNQSPKKQIVKEVAFYLSGGYHCDDNPLVDIVFYIGETPKKYQIEGSISTNNSTIFFLDDLSTHEMKTDFLKASTVKIRVNESHCNDDYYVFNMGNSKTAYQFMLK